MITLEQVVSLPTREQGTVTMDVATYSAPLVAVGDSFTGTRQIDGIDAVTVNVATSAGGSGQTTYTYTYSTLNGFEIVSASPANGAVVTLPGTPTADIVISLNRGDTLNGDLFYLTGTAGTNRSGFYQRHNNNWVPMEPSIFTDADGNPKTQ